jgi:hypothetical protein
VKASNMKGIIVKLTYRAKIGFGALMLEEITVKIDYESQTISTI